MSSGVADEQQNATPTHPFRIRTITAFIQLPPVPSHWEQEVAAAGAFLHLAQQHLEQLGYEVQTTRIATQPFPLFLNGPPPTSNSNTSSLTHSQQQQQQVEAADPPQPSQPNLISNAVKLEAIAAKHGIRLVSIGSSNRPQDLALIPSLIAATHSTSCSFALPVEPDLSLAQEAAAAIMKIAALTGGMGNFRFAVSSNVPPGVPYFPVAASGPGLHHTFALGTECDALLHQAFAAAAAAAAAAAGGGGCSSSRADVLALAQQQLAQVMTQHLQPLEAAALQIEAAAAAAAAAGGQAGAPTPLLGGSHSSSNKASPKPDSKASGSSSSSSSMPPFRYLGMDTSIAPGLDTSPLTDSYELLGCGRFGGAGSLTVSSCITKVLKGLPVRMTGYCGLMLAVCEDQGLAAAAAHGNLTISRLLQYSAVCGCGLDTVPIPGPALASDTAAADDAATTASIASLLCDVNTLAVRLDKPLACRLLPLPGKAAGQPTGFSHPYMVNSHVMDCNT